MTVRIGNSRIDENGNAHGGAAGDQTGNEIRVQTWYSKPWTLVLRPRNAAVAEKMAQAMEAACANDNIGYDQWQRETAHTQAKKVNYDLSRITTKCECDCSSLVALCAMAAGVDVYTGNGGKAPTTGKMRSVYEATGAFEVLTDAKYLESDTYLKRGDVLLKPGSHTAMVLDNGAAEQPKAEEDKPAGTIGEGSTVAFKAGATNYYPGGGKISETAARPYYHIVTQVKTKAGKTVTKGGEVCVLLGRKVKKSGGAEVAGINTWVALSNLELVSGGVTEEPEETAQPKPEPAPKAIGVGSVVTFKTTASNYYPGGSKVSETAARPYQHIVTQITSKGKQVVKGGAVCVLLGKKKKPGSTTVQKGINTWVAVDNLEIV